MKKHKKLKKKHKTKLKTKSKPKKPKLGPNVDSVYETWIEFICPVRGKVKQKVLVKKMKDPMVEYKKSIQIQDAIDELAKTDDGLHIYSEEDLK